MRGSRTPIAVTIALVVTVTAAVLPPTQAAVEAPRHDFDADTLAAYVSLRFSSAVPSSVVEEVLAREGFSQRDLAMASAATRAGGSLSAAGIAGQAARPRRGVIVPPPLFVRQISRDGLRCARRDPDCERDTEAEPDIAVNPTDPNNLVGAFQMGRYPNGGAADVGWAASFDGGRTWPAKGPAPGLTLAVSPEHGSGPGAPFQRASDPVVAFDRKHDRVYLNSISVANAGCAVFCDSALTLNISRNGGHDFGPPVVAHEDVEDAGAPQFVFNDKNWIVTDNHPGSPHYGRTYVVWDQVRCQEPSCTVLEQPILLTWSDDGGEHWHKAVEASPDEQPAQSHQRVGVQPLVLPNGHVVIVYADAAAGVYTFSGDYRAIRSNDGGTTWSQPDTITTADPFAEESASLRAPNVPSATVSGRRIFVAFQDQRFNPGRNDVVLTGSTDAGRTWSPLINVTPGEAGRDHFNPDIAAVGRTLHLTYRTRRPGNLEDSPIVGAFYRRLGGGGDEIGDPKRLGGRSSNANHAAFVTIAGQGHVTFFGDYAGIAAARRGLAHPIWDQAQRFRHQHQNQTDTHQRSFSARATG